LSDTMLFTAPGSWLRMLCSISREDSANKARCQRSEVSRMRNGVKSKLRNS
jgi:hypothetical protein